MLRLRLLTWLLAATIIGLLSLLIVFFLSGVRRLLRLILWEQVYSELCAYAATNAVLHTLPNLE